MTHEDDSGAGRIEVIIQVRDVLGLLAVVSLGAAAYNSQSPSWYSFIAFGLLLYAARDLFRGKP